MMTESPRELSENWYKYGILDVCDRLHSGKLGGTGDPLRDDVATELLAWLKMRVEGWQPSRCPYDDTVLSLCRAALAEWRQGKPQDMKQDRPQERCAEPDNCVRCGKPGGMPMFEESVWGGEISDRRHHDPRA